MVEVLELLLVKLRLKSFIDVETEVIIYIKTTHNQVVQIYHKTLSTRLDFLICKLVHGSSQQPQLWNSTGKNGFSALACWTFLEWGAL